MNIDILKYGFIELQKSDSVGSVFEKIVKDFTIQLIVVSDIYTLSYILNGSKVKVANRYRVETQEQFDFLILNGRVGWLFKNYIP